MEYLTLPVKEFVGWLVMVAVMAWGITSMVQEMNEEERIDKD